MRARRRTEDKALDILLDDLTGSCHKVALDECWGGCQRRRQDSLMPAYSERMIWRAEDNDRFSELAKRSGPQTIEEMFGEEGLKKAYGEKDKP